MALSRRQILHTAAALSSGAAAGLIGRAAMAAPVAPLPLLRPRRLRPGDTIALINPSNAVYEEAPYVVATESLQALGFKVREAPHLRSRRGQFGGTDVERAGDVNAMFADPKVDGILAMTGGSGGNRILPLIDYALIRRTPKFLGGFSDLTALINAVHRATGLVTFHCPVASSEWNAFSVEQFRAVVMEGQTPTLRNPPDPGDGLVPRNGRTATIRSGKGSGPLVGGNLAVLSAMAGSPWWPEFDGAVLLLEETNEYIYRVDRMLSTLKLTGALDRLAGVALGAFTNCEPGNGFGTLTLDDVFADYFGGLGVPVYRGAQFGHIKRKFTLPLGVPTEIDADAGTLRLLQPAVL